MALSARWAEPPLAIAVVDIDHITAVNDTHSHLVGDRALQVTAEILLETARRSDSVGRYGGEEFVLLAPDVSSQALNILGEKFLQAFRKKPVFRRRQRRRRPPRNKAL